MELNLKLDSANPKHLLAAATFFTLLADSQPKELDTGAAEASEEDRKKAENEPDKQVKKRTPKADKPKVGVDTPKGKNPSVYEAPDQEGEDKDEVGDEVEEPPVRKKEKAPSSKSTPSREISRADVRVLLAPKMSTNRLEVVEKIKELGAANFATLPDELLGEFADFLESLD